MMRSERTTDRSTSQSPSRRRGLASARDRRRLRERHAAERARVERALATAPLPSEPDPAPVRARARRRPARRVARWERAYPARADSAPRPSLRCGVCAGSDVVVDEVMHDGLLRLALCRRCAHRWTQRPSGAVSGGGCAGDAGDAGSYAGDARHAGGYVSDVGRYAGDARQAGDPGGEGDGTGSREVGSQGWGGRVVADHDLLPDLPF